MSLPEDPLSQLLAVAGARAVVSTGLQAGGRWAVSVPAVGSLKFNAICRGTCELEVEGRRWQLTDGDCFLVAPDLAFVIGSDLSSVPRRAEDVFAGCNEMPFARLDAGDGPDMLCLGGRMDLPQGAELLVEALPPVTVIVAGSPAAARIGWLLERLEAEQREAAPGATAMTVQIMQMIFIELIRGIPPAEHRGWIASLSDPRIGPVIREIHREPGRNWRLEDLAKISHLSRSRFAARFRATVGRAPMDYVLHWRMTLARKALAKPGSSVSAVAAEFGYASESAFGLAFRRVTGATPRQASRNAT
ncbi:MAG: AraC family transcriptional regulator [Alphaproteobacteria bacterium]|nr:AraC family transcriptional regulator [Alphaproteobacteria bacterium]MBU1551346.1 AraC family transcriptional regulator [Alphaproteobacteria bacterium]MBU2336555.1 AraC family transcriptional regulator [Alphaproteobacteria bacterium]MBU2387969.1 AraC family transcriptional regulator [Alphaproteobacteria bacterium]